MTRAIEAMGRRAVLLAVTGLLGCDALGSKSSAKKRSDDDEDEDDDKKKKKKKKGGDDESVSSAEASSGRSKPKANDADKLAYLLGRHWAFACSFTLLKNAEAADRKMKEVKIATAGLGLAERAAPNASNAVEQMRAKSYLPPIEKAHGLSAAMAYVCGVSLADAFIGSTIDADITQQLADFEKAAKGANIPETVWRAQLDATKTAGKKGPAVSALQESVAKHYSVS